MATAVFYSKGGQSESLAVGSETTVRGLLRTHGLPTNGVLTRVNGTVVAEQSAVIGPADHVEIWQVRHYDLDITRRPPHRVHASARPPVYAKSVMFDDGGRMGVETEQFDAAAFVDYVEQTFAAAVRSEQLLSPDVPVVVGLSGGRDSVAFLKLLDRGALRVPMTAVTVTGLPDWEEPATFEAALTVARSLGVEHVLVDDTMIAETFRLRMPFHDVMKEVAAGQTRDLVMVITHHVMRRMVEREAEKRGIGTLALGLNSDDLVASVVTWLTSGFTMGGIPRRQIGPMSYVFPLYRITKKELTLYLECVAPELNRQGTPGVFTTGPAERSLAYSVTDHLFDLWPGIDFYMFEGYRAIAERMALADHETCRVCGANYLPQHGVRNPARLCDVCQFFGRQEFAVIPA